MPLNKSADFASKAGRIEAARTLEREGSAADLVLKKKFVEKVCGIVGHSFGKWQRESDRTRCVFRFWRKCFVCGAYERRDF